MHEVLKVGGGKGRDTLSRSRRRACVLKLNFARGTGRDAIRSKSTCALAFGTLFEPEGTSVKNMWVSCHFTNKKNLEREAGGHKGARSFMWCRAVCCGDDDDDTKWSRRFEEECGLLQNGKTMERHTHNSLGRAKIEEGRGGRENDEARNNWIRQGGAVRTLRRRRDSDDVAVS